MSALIRDAPFGQIVRYITNNRVFQYPEERSDFQLTAAYRLDANLEAKRVDSTTSSAPISKAEESHAVEEVVYPDPETVLENLRHKAKPIAPEKIEDGTIIIDWYTTDDPENPQNWLFGKKFVVLLQILLYTMGVYMGSAIYSPSIPGVMQRFGVEIGAASMGLFMYVLAYGIGPLLFSPLSEIPIIGRNPPYIVSYAIFVILCFFGSPCLATGGATLQDVYSLMQLPYVLSLWAFAATCGPDLGPIISGFSITAMNWRWSMWEMLWMNGPIFLSPFFFLAETSPANILLRGAQRLRKLTGDPHLKAQSEINQANLPASAIATETLWRPFQLMLLDPSIAFTAVYTAIIYGIFYSFFEAFPLVYIDLHGFNLGEMSLTFLSVIIGVILSIAWYCWYIYARVNPGIIANGLGAPECAANLILAARTSSSQELASVAQKARDLVPSTPVTYLAIDIASSSSIRDLARDVKEKVGRLNLPVLNSGYSGPVVLKIAFDVFNVNI
ncbi:hypothetical protein E8E11_002993 [Didymella keratinophila]|nr:hypothetical protein E8E11_002993 [Didymella keratinophila]